MTEVVQPAPNATPLEVPPPIDDFDGLIAVVTGGGSGMGRELTRQLAAAGCSVAICDVTPDLMDETVSLAEQGAAEDGHDQVALASFVADVADRDQMDAFASHVAAAFGTESINLLFNNAGVAGAGSFVTSPDGDWDKVFNICWGGVLNGCRSFRPMLMAADRGQIINTSSINGMWACLGARGPHTAYSAAKFAVKGFTEALMVDFSTNAPHLTAAVVMPGHIGTGIMRNTFNQFGGTPDVMDAERLATLRDDLSRRGVDLSASSDDEVRALLGMLIDGFEYQAPTSAAEAAQVILAGVKSGQWRILVGDDADVLDRAVRADPGSAYTAEFTAALVDAGHFGGLGVR